MRIDGSNGWAADGPEEVLADGGYSVRTITDLDKLRDAYALRHDVFCRRLGWVKPRDNRLEFDCFDGTSVSFGAYSLDGELAAYARLLLPHGRFMLEDVFGPLLEMEHPVRKAPDTAELSRLCTVHDIDTDNRHRHDLSLLLIRGICRWCLDKGITTVYAVTDEEKFGKYSRLGLPLKQISGKREMSNGVTAVAVEMEWRMYENGCGTSRG